MLIVVNTDRGTLGAAQRQDAPPRYKVRPLQKRGTITPSSPTFAWAVVVDTLLLA